MPSAAPWSADANVIAFEPPERADCRGPGASDREERFLASSPVRRRGGKSSAIARICHLSLSWVGRMQVRHNNADVLILYGKSCLALGYARNFRQAEWVALPIAAFGLGRRGFRGGDACNAFWDCSSGLASSRWTLTRQACGWRHFACERRHSEARVRNFIPHRLGIRGFFEHLRTDGHRHAVLRWFESLPHVAAGEDLDLLVDDASVGQRARLAGRTDLACSPSTCIRSQDCPAPTTAACRTFRLTCPNKFLTGARSAQRPVRRPVASRSFSEPGVPRDLP